MQKPNPFNYGRGNKKDITYFVVFYVVLALLFIFNELQSQQLSSFGNIYFPIFVVTSVLFIFAWVSGGTVAGEVIYGNLNTGNDFVLDMIVNAVVAGAFIGALAFAPTFLKGFSLLPFSVSPASVAGASLVTLLPTLFIVGVISPVYEQTLINTLFATFIRTMKKGLFPAITTLAAILFFLYFQLLPVALIFAGLTILYIVSGRFRNIVSSPLVVVSFSLGLAAFILAVFHVFAYGSSPEFLTLIFDAFLFFAFVGALDYTKKNSMGSIVVHSAFNTYVYASLVGIPFGIAIFGPIMLVIILAVPFIPLAKNAKQSYQQRRYNVSTA